jgi:hypothetical protein
MAMPDCGEQEVCATAGSARSNSTVHAGRALRDAGERWLPKGLSSTTATRAPVPTPTADAEPATDVFTS